MKKISVILFVVLACSLTLNGVALWQVFKTKAFIATIEKQIVELKVAEKLIKRECWYIVNENTVSSEPDSCGEIVNLGKTIYPLLGEYGFIMSPIAPNTVVRFSVLTETQKVIFRESHGYLYGNNLVVCRWVKDPHK